jgi:C4-dicarboxylate-binding protein DctP
VNAQANTWTNIWLKEFYTAQDGVTATNHGLVASMVITSDAWWQALAPDVQADLAFTIQLVTHERNRFAYQLNEVAQNNLRDAGVPIRTLSDEARADWVRTLAPVWDEFRGEIGSDLISAAVQSGGTS